MFLDEIRQVVRRAASRKHPFEPLEQLIDWDDLRRFVAALLDRLDEESSVDDANAWLHDRLDRYVEWFVLRSLDGGIVQEPALLNTAIRLSLRRILLDEAPEELPRSAQAEVERLSEGFKSFENEPWRATILYAERLSLTLRGQIAPAGQMFLALADKGARRWLLTLEMHQSLGYSDPWRQDRRELEFVLLRPAGTHNPDDPDDDRYWPSHRLEALDLASFGDLDEKYVVHPAEQEELRAVLDPDAPMWSLARALTPDARTLPTTVVGLPLVGLREAGRAAAELGRTASHELRNILLPVDASRAELLELVAGTPTETQLQPVLRGLGEGIERLWRYADWFGRLGEDLDRPPERFGAHAAAKEAIQMANGKTVEQDIAVPDTVSVFGYRDRFILALVNLIRNARQSGAQAVWVRVHEEGQQLFIEVDDNGPGVRPEHVPMLFASSFTTREEGTGEGLAIVRRVIEEEHRGSIGYSRSPRGGSRFSIRIPI